MKQARHFILSIFIASLSAVPASVSAQSSDNYEAGIFNHVGLQFGVGTEGISVGLGATMTPFAELGVGVNLMPSFTISGDMKLNGGLITVPKTDIGPDGAMEYETYDLRTVTVSGKFERITLDAKLSIYPFGGRSTFFVTGGVSFLGPRLAKLSGHNDDVARLYKDNKDYVEELLSENENALSAIVDKSYLKFAEDGNIDAELHVNKVRPYVGLGLGRLAPRHGMGVRFELGCQFTGKIKIYQNDKQVPFEDLLQKADDRLSKVIDRLTFYPVLKISVAGTFM